MKRFLFAAMLMLSGCATAAAPQELPEVTSAFTADGWLRASLKVTDDALVLQRADEGAYETSKAAFGQTEVVENGDGTIRITTPSGVVDAYLAESTASSTTWTFTRDGDTLQVRIPNAASAALDEHRWSDPRVRLRELSDVRKADSVQPRILPFLVLGGLALGALLLTPSVANPPPQPEDPDLIPATGPMKTEIRKIAVSIDE
jgi:hypothetical protein